MDVYFDSPAALAGPRLRVPPLAPATARRAAGRLLTLSYEFPPIGGGGSRVVAGLSRELAAAGWSIDLVTMAFGGLPRRETTGNITVRRVPCWRRTKHHCTQPEAASYVAAALPIVRRLLVTQRPDLVHAHFILPDGLIAWLATRSLGIPYVITAHGSDVPGYNPHRLRHAHRALAPVWRKIVRDAAAVVCPSVRLKTLVKANDPGAPAVVIPNGFDPGRMVPRAKQRRILAVTRMLERKGVQHLLEALDGLDLGFTVDVVGDGPYLPQLRAIAAARNLPVTFWGWIDNESPKLKALYESASIYVLPSAHENFPVGLLEAMASGAAIVTTKGTGCEEVVGDAAWLVRPGDVAGIRNALETLARHPDRCRAYGARARARLENNFDWSAVARRYQEAFGQCLQTA